MNRITRIIWITASIIGLSVRLGGQDNAKAIKYYNRAIKEQSRNSIEKAIQYLDRAISLDAGYKDAHLAMYNIYLDRNEAEKSYQHLRATLIRPGKDQANLLFNTGRMALVLGKYAESMDMLTQYLNLNSRDINTRTIAQHLLDQAQYGQSHRDSVYFKPSLLPPSINTPAAEYLPSLDAMGNTLVFTRRISGNEDLLFSKKSDQGVWMQAAPWPQNTLRNEGAHVISADGKTLVFTRCEWPDGLGSCDLYISVLKAGLWSKPRNMGPPINTPDWESQPSLSADGRTLYFASNRLGGHGGYDIWWSKKTSSGWTKPTNGGPGINTLWDELSPAMHADGRSFYFRSNGWPGYGAFDLFVARMEQNQPLQASPLNLGYPLNDHQDQGAMTVAIDGRSAILTLQQINARNELVTSDLGSVDLPDAMAANPCFFIQGRVLNRQDNSAIPHAMLLWSKGGSSGQYQDTIYTDEEGDYLVVLPIDQTYQIYCGAAGFDFFADRIVADKSTKSRIRYDIYLDNILAERMDTGKTIVLKNVLFGLASAQLEEGSYAELDRLHSFMRSNASLRVVIKGHTDNTGSALNNQTLSALRAEAVRNYLISKGISTDRVRATGYGASDPVSTNDTEEGKALNRRVEIILLQNK